MALIEDVARDVTGNLYLVELFNDFQLAGIILLTASPFFFCFWLAMESYLAQELGGDSCLKHKKNAYHSIGKLLGPCLFTQNLS